ncbi:hypothetical protein [Granulicella arctica]|uniref:Uncharacterized protein n=1 Tax=Granulicella arctica TaxID=940613 RepID=A0A7Y9PIQ7_9BACT|nr:hypothetical protein [Granulicella arctica]NYF80647.1 hypothetical protein [Granulicella arctica]
MAGRTVTARQDLKADPRWLLIQRIVESSSFARASRLSDFLLFISEKTLQGHDEELNEQEIGIRVFGRSANYPRSDDNIVRANASRVRQKLDEYFATTGRMERLRVSLPKGGYVPEFETVEPAPHGAIALDVPLVTPESSSKEKESASGKPKPRIKRFGAAAAILLLFTCLNVWILRKNYRFYQETRQKQNLLTNAQEDKLWALLFKPDEKTIIVPGDAGLNMYTNSAARIVGLQEYISGSYLNTPQAAPPPGFHGGGFPARRYVSMNDLEFANQLARLPAYRSSQVTIRFARELRFDELKRNNAILLGSPNYNPWVQLFDRNLDFRMEYNGKENVITIKNRAPKQGEPSEYLWFQSDPAQVGYALIALTDNLQNDGKVLLVQGTTGYGISTASDTLLNSELMDPVISAASQRNGTLANFEILLKTTFYKGGVAKAQVVAEHVH